MSMIDQDVAEKLNALGVGTLADDLFYEQEPAEKDATQSIAIVYASGGAGNEPNKTNFIRRPTVTIIVSGTQNAPADARIYAEAIQLALQGLTWLVGSKRVSIESQIGGINGLGVDSEQRPMYSMNFQFVTQEAR